MTLNSEYFLIYNGVIALITILMIVLAYRRGFVRQLLNIVALIASIYISVLASEVLASNISLINTFFANQMVEITKVFGGTSTFAKLESNANIALWFLALLIGLRVFFWIVIILIPKYREKNALSFINSFFGMILGILKAFVVLVLLTVILYLPLFTNGKEFIQSGVLYPIDMVIEKVVDNVQ